MNVRGRKSSLNLFAKSDVRYLSYFFRIFPQSFRSPPYGKICVKTVRIGDWLPQPPKQDDGAKSHKYHAKNHPDRPLVLTSHSVSPFG